LANYKDNVANKDGAAVPIANTKLGVTMIKQKKMGLGTNASGKEQNPAKVIAKKFRTGRTRGKDKGRNTTHRWWQRKKKKRESKKKPAQYSDDRGKGQNEKKPGQKSHNQGTISQRILVAKKGTKKYFEGEEENRTETDFIAAKCKGGGKKTTPLDPLE